MFTVQFFQNCLSDTVEPRYIELIYIKILVTSELLLSPCQSEASQLYQNDVQYTEVQYWYYYRGPLSFDATGIYTVNI